VSRIHAPLGVGLVAVLAEVNPRAQRTTSVAPATQVTNSAELRASLVRALLGVEQAAPPANPKLQGL
jgi:hypothetical protein